LENDNFGNVYFDQIDKEFEKFTTSNFRNLLRKIENLQRFGRSFSDCEISKSKGGGVFEHVG
jgi:hypothetical protein